MAAWYLQHAGAANGPEDNAARPSATAILQIPSASRQAAPALTGHLLDTSPFRLAEWRGSVVVVNFWASWCAPCMDELPLLVDLQKRYADRGLQLIGPALDEREPVLAAVEHFGINYPVSADFNGASAAMELLGNQRGALPYSVLLDPEGRISETILGALTAESLETLITSKLGP